MKFNLTRHQTHQLVGVILCITSLVGLYLNIPYSGWLMAAGILSILN